MTETQVREANRHHDYQSERGEAEPTGPCAVCGGPKNAMVHA